MKPGAAMGHARLTEAQERFCAEYWRCRNASQAYRLAYNVVRAKPSTVHRRAAELLKNGKVTARLAAFQSMIDEDFQDMAARVVRELAVIAFSDVSDLFDEDGALIALVDLPPSVTATISAVTVRSSAKGATTPTTVSIRMFDKLRALALLMRICGLERRATAEGSWPASLSDEELEAEIRRLEISSRTEISPSVAAGHTPLTAGPGRL